MSNRTPSRNLAMLLAPADRRVLEEVRARSEHPRAKVTPWQAARLVAIVDRMAAQLVEARKEARP